ncbi:hypothetical protein HQ585_13740 [candidate division KSB1 bacterium]|nr:hypothetical protein [candidate division KSB1 bacterium]
MAGQYEGTAGSHEDKAGGAERLAGSPGDQTGYHDSDLYNPEATSWIIEIKTSSIFTTGFFISDQAAIFYFLLASLHSYAFILSYCLSCTNHNGRDFKTPESHIPYHQGVCHA